MLLVEVGRHGMRALLELLDQGEQFDECVGSPVNLSLSSSWARAL
jgi:hypothetical protein